MTRQYVGARYVPKFYDYNGSANWRSGVEYEALTIVTRNGNSYTSKKPVPSDIGEPENNPEYWVSTGLYNEQVEAYRQLVMAVSENLADFMADGAIGTANLANGSVTNDKVANGSVTNDKVANGAIGTAKLADGSVTFDKLEDNLQAKLKNFVTPEMFGAAGDGSTDDTQAISDAIETGLPVVALGNYHITNTIVVNSIRNTPTIFFFNVINYTGNSFAIKVIGQNGWCIGRMLITSSNGIQLGDLDNVLASTYINVNFIEARNGWGYKIVGSATGNQANSIYGHWINYGTNGIVLDPGNKFVGEIGIYNISFSCLTETGGYAITCNCANHPMTGINLYNLSFEGCHGGIEALNTGAGHSFERVYGFGIRCSEMCIGNNPYPLLKLTGNGLVLGALFVDACRDTSFDLNEYTYSGMGSFNFKVYGRIIAGTLDYPYAHLGYKTIVIKQPENMKVFDANSSITDNNRPWCYNRLNGNATININYIFEGTIYFINNTNSNITVTFKTGTYTLAAGVTIAVSCAYISPGFRYVVTNMATGVSGLHLTD